MLQVWKKNLTKDEKVTTLSGVSGVEDVTLPEQKQKQKVTNRAKTAGRLWFLW